ncbi:MAG: amidase [Acidobacteriota bacterium]|nr:amidase [Acidobacteriota bacterium]
MGHEKTSGSLDRRAFLRYSALGGAAVVAGSSLAGAAPVSGTPDAPSPASQAPGAASGGTFDLEEISVTELQKRMQSGQETARSLAEQYIARIHAMDQRDPLPLRSVLEINPDALAIADRLDAERKAKGPRGPLHGIPILIKDNIATADRMQTTAGSLALVGSKPPKDSFVAQRLRAAGAVLLGKTNLSEWANFRSTHSSSGWTGRGGQCRNPYALDRSPSGSSSGSGAAASANFCAVAIGTETDGSITSPSQVNGLVGLKPTVGLWSRAGIIPISHSQDTAGPMTRTVRDAAILLGAVVGTDPDDPATHDSSRRGHTDYTTFLDANGLKGARIGVPRKGLFGYSPATDRLVNAAIDDLKRLGAVIVDPADLATIDELDGHENVVLQTEFKADLNKYLAGLGPGAPVHTLQDLIAWNAQHAKEEMPYFGQEIFEQSEARGPLTGQEYLDALARDQRLTRAEGIDAVMDTYRLDALVAPTGGPAWLIDLVNGDFVTGGATTYPAVAGYPHITVPCGFDFGLPIGLSFFGRAWSEPTLLKLAYAYEQATKHRRAPKFLMTANLAV